MIHDTYQTYSVKARGQIEFLQRLSICKNEVSFFFIFMMIHHICLLMILFDAKFNHDSWVALA